MAEFELLRRRKFWPIFWTQFCGAFNDNFLKNALVILITYRSKAVFGLPAEQVVALSGGVFILPFFLFSGMAGELADRFEKSQIVRIVKACEVVIMALACVGFISSQFEFLLIVLFLMGLHSTFFGPIKYSILPQHLAVSDVVGANALVEAGTFVAILFGTIMGGGLIATGGGPLVVSIGLMIVAILGLGISFFIPLAPPLASSLPYRFGLVRPTIEVIHEGKKRSSVWSAILAISWFWAFGAILLSLFPALCRDILRGDEHLVTSFLGIFSIGIAVGSLIAGFLAKGRVRFGCVLTGSVGLAVFSVLLAVACGSSSSPIGVVDLVTTGRGLILFLILAALSCSGGLFIVPLYALMQSASDPSARSRVIAANNIMNALFMVVASVVLVGLFRCGFSITQVLFILGGFGLAVTLVLYKAQARFR